MSNREGIILDSRSKKEMSPRKKNEKRDLLT